MILSGCGAYVCVYLLCHKKIMSDVVTVVVMADKIYNPASVDWSRFDSRQIEKKFLPIIFVYSFDDFKVRKIFENTKQKIVSFSILKPEFKNPENFVFFPSFHFSSEF